MRPYCTHKATKSGSHLKRDLLQPRNLLAQTFEHPNSAVFSHNEIRFGFVLLESVLNACAAHGASFLVLSARFASIGEHCAALTLRGARCRERASEMHTG